MEKNRKEEVSLIEKAKEYFDLHNLTQRVQTLFEADPVKKLIHEKYGEYEAELKEVVDEFLKCDFPKPIADRAKEVYKQVINKEKIYADDVRLSLVCSVYQTLQSIEKFVMVDESIENIFRNALTEENETMMEALSQICEGVKLRMIDKVIKVISIPFGVPEELMDFLMELSGGMPMMNMEEMESMFEKKSDSAGRNQRSSSKGKPVIS